MPSSTFANSGHHQRWDAQQGSAQDLASYLENSEGQALVFVSHSRADDEWTKTVFETLKRASQFIDVLIDKRQEDSWEALIEALTPDLPLTSNRMIEADREPERSGATKGGSNTPAPNQRRTL